MTDLTVRSIRGGYPNAEEIVKGIDLDVRAGDLTVIIGPNGGRQVDLPKLVAGLLKPTSGEISLQGKPPTRALQLQERHEFVPQERNVFASRRSAKTWRWAGTFFARG